MTLRVLPFKVIGTNTDRSATYEYLLVFQSIVTMNLSRTITEINGHNFPTRVYAPAKGFSMEVCNGGGAQKTIMMPLPGRQNSVTICAFFYAQQRHWTDIRTDLLKQYRTHACI